MSTLLRRSLLDNILFERGNVLSSHGIQRRYFEAVKATKIKAAANGRHTTINEDICLLNEEDFFELNKTYIWLKAAPKNGNSKNNGNKSENNSSKSENNPPKKIKLNKIKIKKIKLKEALPSAGASGNIAREMNELETFERIRLLRKNKLKLSQEQFGKRLGVSRSVIANIETNALSRPEQKEPLYRLICKTFNINYEWLITGQGDMYVESQEEYFENLAEQFGLGFYARKILDFYGTLEKEQKNMLELFIKDLVYSIVEAETPINDEEDKKLEKERATAFKIASRDGEDTLALTDAQRKEFVRVAEEHTKKDNSDIY